MSESLLLIYTLLASPSLHASDLYQLVADLDTAVQDTPYEYAEFTLLEDPQHIAEYVDPNSYYTGGVFLEECHPVTPAEGARWLRETAQRILETSDVSTYRLAFRQMAERLQTPHEVCTYQVQYADDPWSGTNGTATLFEIPGDTEGGFMFVETYTWVE